jgi:hypothetical protein
MNRYQELLALVQSFESDFRKFYEKENREAGVRLRKNMQELRQLAQCIRDEVQNNRAEFAPKIPRSKKSTSKE